MTPILENLSLWELSAAINGELVLSPWLKDAGSTTRKRFNAKGQVIVEVVPWLGDKGFCGWSCSGSVNEGCNSDPTETHDSPVMLESLAKLLDTIDARLEAKGFLLASREEKRLQVMECALQRAREEVNADRNTSEKLEFRTDKWFHPAPKFNVGDGVVMINCNGPVPSGSMGKIATIQAIPGRYNVLFDGQPYGMPETDLAPESAVL